MIYFSLIIPLITVIFLSWKFPKQVVLWERLLVFIVPIIAIVVSKFLSVASLTNDIEYWNSYCLNSTYYEYWNEWIIKKCCAEEDTNGNCIEWEDCSYEEEHQAYWEVVDNIGKTHKYDQCSFEQAAKIWNNRKFMDMHRDYHTKDGDAYITKYDGIFEHTIPICEQHTYKNKVQCSRSVFNFENVDTSEIRIYGLFSYPDCNKFNYNPLLGIINDSANYRLRCHNSYLGNLKQVHMMVLVFNNQPYQVALKQEQLWKKGNKNEFILCIGIKDNKITWTYIISWTDEELLKINVAKKAKKMEYNLTAIIDMMAKEVNNNFVRKKFADFNYINVEPTTTAVIITFIITLIVAVGISLYVVLNDIKSER